ncbi:MAG: hypothetical protein HONBIEJF_02279 [Fimbriimonadaceae bacterium]|nr:hypothetical protein [Fimbriimonadaceae bacterium]
MKKGITAIELLVVMTIIGLLAAIVSPTIVHGKRFSSRAVCFSNLRQHHVAIMLYQADHNQSISSYPMGLPLTPISLYEGGYLKRHTLKCGGTGYPFDTHPVYVCFYPDIERWQEHHDKMQGQAVLMADYNHQAKPNHILDSPYLTHRAFAITYEGSIRTQTGMGRCRDLDWWVSR